MRPPAGNRASFYAVTGLTVAAVLVVWLPVPYEVRLPGAALLAFFLPGWALINAVWPEMRDVLERLVLAVGLSYAATVLVSLIVLYWQGQVAAAPVVGVLGVGSLALAVVGKSRAKTEGAWDVRLNGRDLAYVLLCAIPAAFLTFVNLDYADYWGDEMNGLLRAISVIAGHPDSIFEHTKGPVEILLPAVFGLLAGRFDPFTVRLPFALAHVAAIGSFYLLVRRMFSQNVALLAAAFLAINGLYLAFGRMVQYQTVVFLTTALSVLAAYRFYQSGVARYLGVSAVLTGVGLLAHYDVLLTLPVIAFLIWGRYARHHAEWRVGWPRLALAIVLLLLAAGLFYLPFVLRPHLAETSPYLARRIGGTTWPANNVDELYVFAVLYNSAYYVLFIAILGMAKLWLDLRRLFVAKAPGAPDAPSAPGETGHGTADAKDRKSGASRRRVPAKALIAAAVALSLIAVFLRRVDMVPLIACSASFALLIGLAPLDFETRTMYVWFAVSFVGYVFLVDHPRTHLRMIYPPWLVLVGLAVAGLARTRQTAVVGKTSESRAHGDGAASGDQLPRGAPLERLMISLRARLRFLGTRWAMFRPLPARWMAAPLLGLLFLLFAGYQYLLFVDTQAEYILTYPEHKSQLYLEDPRFPFGSRRLYGAPHRLGWQMVNQLFLNGELQGDWDSNDEGTNLFWYTLGAPQSPCYPRYYFASQFEQRDAGDSLTQPAFPLDRYARIGQVWNRDRLEIDVYEFAPLGGQGEATAWVEPGHYDSYVTPGDFESDPYDHPLPSISQLLASAEVFRPGPVALQRIAEHYADERIKGVADKVALLGYDLEDRWAKPGGVVVLTLYWQALEVVNLPYKVFVHMGSVDGSKTWAQADDWPACGTQPTQRWPVGQVVTDRHVIELPLDIPTGEHSLLVGLYEPQTAQRMDLLDAMGNPQGTSVTVATLRVQAVE